MGSTRRRSGPGVAAAALTVLVALTAAGCSGDEAQDAGDAASPSESASASGSGSGSGSESPSATEPSPSEQEQPERTVIPITVRGDSVEPRGKRVEVAVGEPFVFAIDADTAGELHVHATPEAELAFSPGKSRQQLVLDRPGIVEVELHEPTEVTVVQLEVR